MAASSLLDSPTSSRNLSPSTKENLEDSADSHFWKSLQRRVKVSNLENKDLKSFLYRKAADPENVLRQSNTNRSNTSSRATTESRWRKNEDSMALHKGLEAIASSLSLLSETLGTAIEEGLTLAETKAAAVIENETKPQAPEKPASSSPKEQEESDKNSGLTKDTQLKASRDVAMAMATKAKLLLRELKGVKTDLTYTKSRCAQLEEENKRLRENLDKGVRQEEDDLVRLQLEALLAEKARLAQENAEYARENQFLHEVVQYHQLKLRDIALPDDESLIADDDEIIGEEGIDDSTTVDMVDFLPLYPEEKDIIALEDNFRNKKLNF